MQIVIDIDEKRFRDIQRISTVQLKRRTPTLEQVIANGILLPKGHGRLIDADVLISGIKDLKKSQWYKDNTNFAYLPRKEAVAIIEEIIIGDAPTIIEADKEAEDDNN